MKSKRKRHALGLLVKDRWTCTEKVLHSLRFSELKSKEYDLFIIDNGSTLGTRASLKSWLATHSLPLKNMFFISESSIGTAWNLFLIMTRDYAYRTTMDNDLVLFQTPVLSDAPVVSSPRPIDENGPGDYGTNPGAPVGGKPVMGAMAKPKPKKASIPADSRFLTGMEKFGREVNAELVCMIPVAGTDRFLNSYIAVHNNQFLGLPYLVGGCIQISKKCFESVGYFDENLLSCVHLDYSQRTLKCNMNIAYFERYGILHFGANQPTCDQRLKRNNDALSMKYLQERELENQLLGTSWSDVEDKIRAAAEKSTVVRLESAHLAQV